jgi:hypothetical protein
VVAISVSVVGILLGSIYPIVINHTAGVLPRHLVNGTVRWMSACGAGGSTLLPFVTGAMASNFGIKSLQPFCNGQCGVGVGVDWSKIEDVSGVWH